MVGIYPAPPLTGAVDSRVPASKERITASARASARRPASSGTGGRRPSRSAASRLSTCRSKVAWNERSVSLKYPACQTQAVVNSRDVPAVVATRARIVLWTGAGRMRKEVGALAGVSLPTVDRWLARYERFGLAGLEEHKRGGGREQVPAAVRARILALTRTTPPVETGLSHWSSREMARHVSRTEGVAVSWHYVAKLWRDNDLQPHQQGPNVTFHFTPVGSSWLNQIEIWFGNITRQSIRRGTFTSVAALVARIRDYVAHWNTDAQPFTWTATADEILAKVRWVQTTVKQLVQNNTKEHHESRDTSTAAAVGDSAVLKSEAGLEVEPVSLFEAAAARVWCGVAVREPAVAFVELDRPGIVEVNV